MHLDSPEFLEALGEEDDHDAERARLVTELEAIETHRQELAGMWGRRQITTSEWRAAKDGLDSDERRMNAELAAIPAPSEPVDIEATRDGWEGLNLDEQREFLRRHIAKVTIHKATKMGPQGLDTDRITIEWA